MHIRTISRTAPAAAANIQIWLDIVLQFINVLEAIERFTGIDLFAAFTSKGGGGGTPA
jgi:hypothetical protein